MMLFPKEYLKYNPILEFLVSKTLNRKITNLCLVFEKNWKAKLLGNL